MTLHRAWKSLTLSTQELVTLWGIKNTLTKLSRMTLRQAQMHTQCKFAGLWKITNTHIQESSDSPLCLHNASLLNSEKLQTPTFKSHLTLYRTYTIQVCWTLKNRKHPHWRVIRLSTTLTQCKSVELWKTTPTFKSHPTLCHTPKSQPQTLQLQIWKSHKTSLTLNFMCVCVWSHGECGWGPSDSQKWYWLILELTHDLLSL